MSGGAERVVAVLGWLVAVVHVLSAAGAVLAFTGRVLGVWAF